MPAPPRDNLCRSVAFELRADEDASGDGLTLDGYAAVFDSPTEIDSWEGTFSEQIAFGAFRKSLQERTPKLQFDHGAHPLIGSLPIGRWESIKEERSTGLHTIGRLHDNWLVEPVRDAIAEGSVDGMSFRFSVVRDEWRDKDGVVLKPDELDSLLWNGAGKRGPLMRTLKEVKITEAGPVVWPAYADTSVGVRSRVTIDLARLGDPRERKTLARAVFLADAAQRDSTGPTETTDAPPVEGHPSSDTVESPDTPPAAPDGPDGHLSAPSRSRHAGLDLWLRKTRDTLLDIETRGRTP
jgi:HK97 family phage prohead protease